MYVKEGASRSTDDVDKEDLPSLSSRTPTPILSLGIRPTSEETENSSVGQEQVEKEVDKGVESNTGDQPLGAIVELPINPEDGLGEPAKNNILDSVDIANNPNN